jgi:hypothetical protein
MTKTPKRSPLSLVEKPPGDSQRTMLGDCTCGYGLPDLLIGCAASPPKIVMICPECGQQWELGLTKATPESVADVLDIENESS